MFSLTLSNKLVLKIINRKVNDSPTLGTCCRLPKSYCKELHFLIPESSHRIVTNYDKWAVWIFPFLTQRPHTTPTPNNPYKKYQFNRQRSGRILPCSPLASYSPPLSTYVLWALSTLPHQGESDKETQAGTDLAMTILIPSLTVLEDAMQIPAERMVITRLTQQIRHPKIGLPGKTCPWDSGNDTFGSNQLLPHKA